MLIVKLPSVIPSGTGALEMKKGEVEVGLEGIDIRLAYFAFQFTSIFVKPLSDRSKSRPAPTQAVSGCRSSSSQVAVPTTLSAEPGDGLA